MDLAKDPLRHLHQTITTEVRDSSVKRIPKPISKRTQFGIPRDQTAGVALIPIAIDRHPSRPLGIAGNVVANVAKVFVGPIDFVKGTVIGLVLPLVADPRQRLTGQDKS